MPLKDVDLFDVYFVNTNHSFLDRKVDSKDNNFCMDNPLVHVNFFLHVGNVRNFYSYRVKLDDPVLIYFG